jgi:hypothetical protein
MVKVNNFYPTVIYIKENIFVENLKEKVNILGKMELFIKASFYLGIAMVEVLYQIKNMEHLRDYL